MLKIGIDIRCLMTPIRTGVGEYTYELLNAIFKIDKENQYYLFYNSYTDVSEHTPLWSQNNIHYVVTKWPNKLFNASIKILGWPKLDKLISRSGKLDYFFSPNFNFTALSKNVRRILTVHDLSFKFFPQFFSAPGFSFQPPQGFMMGNTFQGSSQNSGNNNGQPGSAGQQ